MNERIFGLAFLIVAAFDLIQIQYDGSRWISKSLIMPILIIYYLIHYSSLNPSKPKLVFGLALVAAWAGDCFLLFEDYFLFGLGSFLLMQVLYSYCFWRDKEQVRRKWMYIFVLMSLTASVATLLWSELEDMKGPVILYMSAISTMSFLAYIRNANSRGYYWVFVGSLFFIVSDAVLAIHQFQEDIFLGKLTVMSTYILAQYCIVHGYILDHKK